MKNYINVEILTHIGMKQIKTMMIAMNQKMKNMKRKKEEMKKKTQDLLEEILKMNKKSKKNHIEELIIQMIIQ